LQKKIKDYNKKSLLFNNINMPEVTDIVINDAFENAQKQIKKSCDLFDKCEVDENIYTIISHPKRVIEVSLPIKMDNGKVRIFTAYRSQHNDSR
jgi:hypothetical protein